MKATENIQQLWAQSAERFGPSTAIATSSGNISYHELEARANKLANFLLSAKTSPQGIVVIYCDDVVEIITAIIATLKAGCVFVPLDPQAPERRLAAQLSEINPQWFVTEARFVSNLPRLFAAANVRPAVICAGTADGPPAGAEDLDFRDYRGYDNTAPVASPLDPDQMCYVYFTSGSTGRPKAIAGRVKGIDHFIRWEIKTFAIGAGTRVSQFTTPAFDAFLRDVFVPLVAGGTVCVPPNRDFILDARRLVTWMDEEEINLIHCVPSLFRAILNEGPDLPKFSALRHVLMAGEPLLSADVRRWMELYGERVQLVNLYGPTETTMTKLFYPVTSADQERRVVPIGKPMEGARALIVDARGRSCPRGAVGEIYIRTPYRTLGYLNQPELTNEVFIPNPFTNKPNDLVYRTGDMGRELEDGNFEFLGRRDQQVKIRGARIELAEINSLLHEHPAVRDVAVIDRDDSAGDKFLCAYVVMEGETRPDELKPFLSGLLPGYMIPSAFVALDELPRTLSGKIDRQALPPPGDLLEKQRGSVVAPSGPIEELLAGLWSQLLGIEKIGVHDDFFSLGGHSLLATQLLSRVRAVFGVEVSLRKFFESRTIVAIAAQIEAALKTGAVAPPPPVRRAGRGTVGPLSFAQQRLWFLQQMEPGTPAYNMFDAVRLTGPLNFQALERTVNEIAARHEVLRSAFVDEDGQPVQVIREPSPVTLPLIDLSDLPETDREGEMWRLINAEYASPFALETGPPFRVRLLRLAAQEHVLLCTMHHIISDGWSMAVLFKEVTALYDAFARGEESPLSELPVQYADYTLWQREWLTEDLIEEQLAYWQQQLASAPRTTSLPSRPARAEAPSSRGETEYFTLPASLSRTLRTLSRNENATLFMTLLAGFAALLSRRTGQLDLVVGTDIANRTYAEVEPLIGFFVNQLALRVDLSDDPSFDVLVRRVRETCLGAYANQDVPFERVVAEVGGNRAPGQTPLFQVLFVVQNAPTATARLPGLVLTPIEHGNTTSKFDLILQIVETETELAGIWRYRLDVLDAETVREFGRQLETLLESAARRPQERVSKLDLLSEADKLKQAEEERNREQESLQRFRTIQPKPRRLTNRRLVNLEAMNGGRLPLVIKPATAEPDLADWIKTERAEIESLLVKHGALLFRGFSIDDAKRFEQVALAHCSELFDQYGDLPRTGVAGGKVYTSTPYPAEQAILFHNESSHLQRWPLKIMFCCLVPPARGGATPLVDCRDVLNRLGPRLREQFASRGVMYVRNFTDGLDVGWREFFGTDDRAHVEEICRRTGIEFEWIGADGLRTRRVCHAVVKHPRTGDQVMFHQVQAHHMSLLESSVRESLLQLFGETGLPRNVYYGDGGPISAEEMAELVRTYEEGAIDFAWEKGDVLLVDNMLVAHGRRPFEGERSIIVAMGEMISEQDLDESAANSY